MGHAGQWLVFADDEGLADQLIVRLREHAGRVVALETGDGFGQIAKDHYESRPGSRQDLRRVLAEFELDENEELRVLHFWTISEEEAPETDVAAFRWAFDRGFFTLIALVQAAHDCRMVRQVSVQVYTDGLSQVDTATDALHPEKGALLPPCQVMPQEIRGLSMRCIDVPAGSDLVEDIFREAAADSKHALTALRADGRYTQELFELPELVGGLPCLRLGGTVLITGGVGGLGLKFAEHLFNTRNARLVLTSRWEPPPRDEWPDYIDQDSKIGRAIRILSPLLERGAELLIVRANASDRDEMQQVVSEAIRVFGPNHGQIHGVLHAAGVVDDGPALQKTREKTGKVFAAKVLST